MGPGSKVMIQIIFLTLVIFVVGVSVFSVCRVFAPAILLFEIQPNTRWNACRSWFNSGVSIIGWVAFLILALKLHYCIASFPCLPELSWANAGLVLVAFVGITGYVPATVTRLVAKIREYGFRVGNRLSQP